MTTITDEERAALDSPTRAHLNVFGYLPEDAPPPSYLSPHAQKLDAELRAAGFPGFAQYSRHDLGESYTEVSKRVTAVRIEKLRDAQRVSLDTETDMVKPLVTVVTTTAPPVTVAPAVNGASFSREWHGETHTVTALDDGGFEYRGQRYGSLSKIAKMITGTSWSGPVFFRTNGKSTRKPTDAPAVVAPAATETDVLAALSGFDNRHED